MVEFQYTVPLTDRAKLFIRSYGVDFERLESIAQKRYALLPETLPENAAEET